METIISAAITGAVTLAICLITNNANAKRTEALIEYRLKALEEKQNIHNGLITKVTELAIRQDENKKDIDEVFKRIREIEKGA
ncbi:MAG: hypothetical protein IJP92_00865 [Lachnospiraceae bacterium]|nr:hypothetical protein [Lachnospiraceae bacterium]